jgi:hypothetical protein
MYATNMLIKTSFYIFTYFFPEIPADSQKKIFELFGRLLDVWDAHVTDGYEDALAKLPAEFRDSYHDLWQMAVMYVIIMFDVRRGREGLCEIRKDAYEKQSNSVTGFHFYQKVLGESSKNHQDDKENLEKSGIIPFYQDEQGFNPGRLLEVFLKRLHPENAFLFQRPVVVSPKFKICQDIWYTKAKIGKNKERDSLIKALLLEHIFKIILCLFLTHKAYEKIYVAKTTFQCNCSTQIFKITSW